MQQNVMAEKEVMTDLLSSQKFLTGNYNNFAGECCDLTLRNAFLSILDDEHQIQSDIFNEMNSRGWYQITPADTNQISKAKQTFVGMQA